MSGLELSAPPFKPGRGGRLEIELTTKGQRCNQLCLYHGTSGIQESFLVGDHVEVLGGWQPRGGTEA